MGLDVYVGSLTRYTIGDWLTVVQQAGLASGTHVEVIRTSVPSDAIKDPVRVRDAVLAWQSGLINSIGGGDAWPESAGLPYWTDKPDWDGYGGLVLLAAYQERPDLVPQEGSGLFGRRAAADIAREFSKSRAVQEAAKSPTRYPTLLSGVEWWLPVDTGPTVFTTQRLTGQATVMGRVDQLVVELRRLALGLGIASDDELAQLRYDGPPSLDADVQAAGRFGLSVFHALARTALQERQPLLLDY